MTPPSTPTPCTHDLSERETAVADGYCPFCLQTELIAAHASIDGALQLAEKWEREHSYCWECASELRALVEGRGKS